MGKNKPNPKIVTITDDGMIQIPEDLLLEVNLHGKVELISCREGILIKPKKSKKSWQEIFQNKAKMGNVLYMDLSEVRLDDIL